MTKINTKFKTASLVMLVLLSLPSPSLAYSPDTTHAGLTEQIVEFHNLSSKDKQINKDQQKLIIQGSIDEDKDNKPLNHFYDPVRNSGFNNGRSAKQWALGDIEVNEYTWSKIIQYYAEGNEKEAYLGLGHILHLIEDVSVPDHTRNDAHKGEWLDGLYTGNSPFEDWARDNNLIYYLWAKNWKVTMAQTEVIIEKQRRSRPRFREF